MSRNRRPGDFRGFAVHNAWPSLVAGTGIAGLLPVLRRLRRGFRGTALEPAWHWAGVVWLTWVTVPVITIVSPPLSAWGDALWYFAAVLALTPPIAVLGARRPTSRVWTWFVLVPLVLVFTWPLLPVLREGGGPSAFSLEEPVVVGYALVLVMGAGNYLGLRFSLSALLWMTGLLLVVLPLCPATAPWLPGGQTGRVCGSLCLAAAGWIADRQIASRKRPPPGPPLDRVWRDFRDLFGIVWARRVQERFNDEACRQGLPVRLGLHGLQSAGGEIRAGGIEEPSLAVAEASLRWLLQKFVDPAWIDARLAR
jgi:hypothetical protein